MIQQEFSRTPQFLEQFHNFDDAVVREFRLLLGNARDGSRATIALEACDLHRDGDDGWAKVVLTVLGVTEYRFVENTLESHYVLSLGLKFNRFDGLYYFDFASESDESEGLEDFRRSHFYVAGRGCSWEVKPYPKSWLRKPQEARHGRH